MSGRAIPFTGSDGPRYQGAQRNQRVVQIGRDGQLLRLRGKVLSTAGYIVHSATPDEAPAEVRKASGVQVWVFCHTIEFYELALLAVAIRSSRPADKLLRLNTPNDIGQLPGLFDGFLEPAHGVEDLLRAVDDLANNHR